MLKKIKCQNFKIIEFLDINPKRGVTFIFGPNESGKSTVMDVVETTLVGGKKILNPVRDNQKKAETEIELDDYVIKKIFTDKSVRLEVYDKEGVKQIGGLKLIEKLINKIGFDPHEFTRLNAKDQRKMLLELLKIDFTDLDKQREKIFEERRDVGSQRKVLPTYEEQEISVAEDYCAKPEININELSEKLQEEQTKVVGYNTAQSSIEENKKQIKIRNDEIETAKRVIMNLNSKNDELSLIKKPTADIEKMKKELDNADKKNISIRNSKEIISNQEKIVEFDLEYAEKSKKMNAIDTHKQNVLKNAEMPLNGLAITEDCVIYEDRPFEQLSTSQKMKVSIAICLLLMDNKKEKIIMIREGNLLDSKSIDIVIEMAKENNCYFFIEYVLDEKSELPREGLLIQEGKIIAVNDEPVK